MRGDYKQQGDWGETQLKIILEKCGLREGYEYELQEECEQNTNNVCSWYSSENIPLNLLEQLQEYLKNEYDVDFNEEHCFSKNLFIDLP